MSCKRIAPFVAALAGVFILSACSSTPEGVASSVEQTPAVSPTTPAAAPTTGDNDETGSSLETPTPADSEIVIEVPAGATPTFDPSSDEPAVDEDSGFVSPYADIKTPEFRGQDPANYQFLKGSRDAILTYGPGSPELERFASGSGLTDLREGLRNWRDEGATPDAIGAFYNGVFDCGDLVERECVKEIRAESTADGVRVSGVYTSGNDLSRVGDYSVRDYRFEMAATIANVEGNLAITGLRSVSFAPVGGGR